MRQLLYHRDFFHARICAYCFFAVYTFVLFFLDPFSYECSDANPCLGCGFRAGVMLLLQGRAVEGLESNVFVGPAMMAVPLALLDVFVGRRLILWFSSVSFPLAGADALTERRESVVVKCSQGSLHC